MAQNNDSSIDRGQDQLPEDLRADMLAVLRYIHNNLNQRLAEANQMMRRLALRQDQIVTLSITLRLATFPDSTLLTELDGIDLDTPVVFDALPPAQQAALWTTLASEMLQIGQAWSALLAESNAE